MKINLSSFNPALKSIINEPNQIITLDANLLIPPDRSRYNRVPIFPFEKFRQTWLDPLFEAFPNLAIHEAVYEEIISPIVKNYIDQKINNDPSQLVVHKDSLLNESERVLRNLIESKIYPYTKYNPINDNKDDRGEVKSLAYIAVKELLYFAANDSNAIQLIEKAEEWGTSLDNVQVIKMYELIYYLYSISSNKKLRYLYRYLYHLTKYEKSSNSAWCDFIETISELYSEE